MQSRRSALSRLRNATSIPLDKLKAFESDRKHRVDVETQAIHYKPSINQVLAIFPTCYVHYKHKIYFYASHISSEIANAKYLIYFQTSYI